QYFIREELYKLIQLYGKGFEDFVLNRLPTKGSPQPTIYDYVKQRKLTGKMHTTEQGDRNVVLSANIALFGNIQDLDKGECTWYYFLHNQSIQKLDTEKLLSSIFETYDIEKKY